MSIKVLSNLYKILLNLKKQLISLEKKSVKVILFQNRVPFIHIKNWLNLELNLY